MLFDIRTVLLIANKLNKHLTMPMLKKLAKRRKNLASQPT